jgi:hypothetical protein
MEHLSRGRSPIGGTWGGGGETASFFGALKDNGAGEKTSTLVSAWVRSPGDTHIYLGSFLWALRTLEVWVWGQCGTSLEGQDSHDSGLGRGHKGPVRPTCIGTVRARPILILFYSLHQHCLLRRIQPDPPPRSESDAPEVKNQYTCNHFTR